MSILIRVGDIPADERVDYLHDVGARIWVPFTAVSEDVSQMEFRATGFGPMQVVMIEGAPFRVSRSPKQIEQADPELLKAYLVCSGNTSVICQDDRQAMLSPGEMALYDTRRPCEQIQGTIPGRRLQLLTFMFPPSMLPLPRNGIRELVATRIPASPGLGELTSQFLQQLARNVDNYTPAEVARLSTAALEVLATRLARELDVRDWGTPEARKHAMLTTVQGFICQHLSDPGLSPAGGGRCASPVAARGASVVPRRGLDRGRVHPRAPHGALPPRPGRPRAGQPPGGGDRGAVGVCKCGGLQPDVPGGARHAARRVPRSRARC